MSSKAELRDRAVAVIESLNDILDEALRLGIEFQLFGKHVDLKGHHKAVYRYGIQEVPPIRVLVDLQPTTKNLMPFKDLTDYEDM